MGFNGKRYGGMFDESDGEDDDYHTFDPISNEITFRVQDNYDKYMKEFKEFLNTPEFISSPNISDNNVIDRHGSMANNKVSPRCYIIPNDKIPRMFKHMEACRRNNLKMMMCEKQQEYSGIMLDFDIYMEDNESKLNMMMYTSICVAVLRIINQYIDINNPDRPLETKDHEIYAIVLRKPKPIYDNVKECYKDGMHILFPGIQIRRELKRLIINRCIEENVFEPAFRDIKPKEGLTYNDFVDINSAHVPVHFFGSATKIDKDAYKYDGALVANYRNENDILNTHFVSVNLDVDNVDSKYIYCHEFSLNWERRDGLISKRKYEIRREYKSELDRFVVKRKEKDNTENELGELSLLSIHDPDAEHIELLLSCLDDRRASDYTDWFKVLCALAHTSKSYKPLADKFSQRCEKKYNRADFEKHWDMALQNSSNNLTIGSIKYWAKKDNPDKYEHVEAQSIFTLVYNKIFEIQTEGHLQHYDYAQILYKALCNKYVFDSVSGDWYEFIIDGEPHIKGTLHKWYKCPGIYPVSMKRYMSENFVVMISKIFPFIDNNIENIKNDDKAKYYLLVKKNLQNSVRQLRQHGFKNGIVSECQLLFNRLNFTAELDKDPTLMGVGNGILRLGPKVELIVGNHNHLISLYTEVDYQPFNPYDPLTKKVLITLRNLFPDNEPDTFDFLMHYIASALDGKVKESLFTIIVGSGCNGKSFLLQLIKGMFGEHYGMTMNITYLTTKEKDAETATPALMATKCKRWVDFSESDKGAILYVPKIKRLTGQEDVAGRNLFSRYENFQPTAHYITSSNYDFEINSTDHGTWRRIKRINMRIKFCKPNIDNYDPNNMYERVADLSIGPSWPKDKEIKSIFLGILCFYYENLQREYKGIVENVPHVNIKNETNKFRNSQDRINKFINSRIVKTADTTFMTPITVLLEKYSVWHTALYPDDRDFKKGLMHEFENSNLSKMIYRDVTGDYIKGCRVLSNAEQPEEGEQFYFTSTLKSHETNTINPQTAEEYYKSICKKYDALNNVKENEIVETTYKKKTYI